MQTIPAALRTNLPIDGYSDEAQARKDAMHLEGAKFLKSLAKTLGLSSGQYTVRSNKAGIAVSGEVTLHADHLYVQLSSSFSKPGLQLLYRSCLSQKDYSGGQNHFVQVSDLAVPQNQAAFLKTCRKLIYDAKAMSGTKPAQSL
jgi:hypothetical protein